MTRKQLKEYDKLGLKVNMNKTKYMCMAWHSEDVMLDGNIPINNMNIPT